MGQLWIEQVSCYLLLTCLFSYPMCGKCCFALYITRRDFSRQKLLADVATCVGKVVADRWFLATHHGVILLVNYVTFCLLICQNMIYCH